MLPTESPSMCTTDLCEIQKRAPPTLPTEGPNLVDFASSRGRGPIAILTMAASGTQPAGDSTPSLLPSPILTMQDHVNFATILNPHAIMLRASVPTFAWGIGQELRHNPRGAIEKRSAALKFLSSMTDRLTANNMKWRAKLPMGSPASRINFALIHFLCSRLDFAGKSIASDLAIGIPLAGDVPDAGVFRKRRRNATVTQEEWPQGLHRRNLDMPERVRKSDGAELTRLPRERH